MRTIAAVLGTVVAAAVTVVGGMLIVYGAFAGGVGVLLIVVGINNGSPFDFLWVLGYGLAVMILGLAAVFAGPNIRMRPKPSA